MGFHGQPQDIACLVSFLVSKESRFITGMYYFEGLEWTETIAFQHA